jgi:hypothetical protein
VLVSRELAKVVDVYLDDARQLCTANNPKIKDLPEKFGENG